MMALDPVWDGCVSGHGSTESRPTSYCFVMPITTAEAQAQRATEAASNRYLASAVPLLLLLAGYFTLQIGLRLITSGTADLDESEQLLATQRLQLGYGPQPPLYTWLLLPLVRLTGPTLLSLAVLKDALLFGIYAMTYACARKIFRDSMHRALATVSLIFLPQLAWESQRDLTHSVLVTFFSTTSFFVLLKLRERRSWHLYVALGLCFGAGLLSKYSFAVFLTGLLIASAIVQSFRSVLWNPRMLLALVVCVAAVAPHGIWALHHADWVMLTSGKLKIATGQGWVETVITGVRNLFVAVGSHLGPLFVIYLLFGWRRLPTPAQSGADEEAIRFIKMALLAMLALLIGGILFFHVTGFKDRWFSPLCIWVPILTVAIFSERLNPLRIRRVSALAAMAALIVIVGIPTRVWLARMWRFQQALNAPYAVLAGQLQRDNPDAVCVIAGDNWVGGNLKLRFPERQIVSPKIFLEADLRPSAVGMLVWDANRNDSLPPALLEFAGQFADVDTNEIRYAGAPLKFWPSRTMKLGYTTCRIRPEQEARTAGIRFGAVR